MGGMKGGWSNLIRFDLNTLQSTQTNSEQFGFFNITYLQHTALGFEEGTVGTMS